MPTKDLGMLLSTNKKPESGQCSTHNSSTCDPPPSNEEVLHFPELEQVTAAQFQSANEYNRSVCDTAARAEAETLRFKIE